MNKTALVTGSSKGIGKGIARLLGENGYNIVVNGGHNKDALETTVKEFQEDNISVLGVFADVSKYEECQYLVKEINSIFGNIDLLVNNAGVSHIGLFTDMNHEYYSNIVNINLLSSFHLCNLIIPSMVREKSGSIIFISSIWGNDGASCEAVYSATKGGINSFSKSLAKELGASNIRVNTISCGAIDTDMNNSLTKEEKDDFSESIALMRFGKVEEIAEVALFLASDKSSYITGQIITVDGGRF